MAYRAQAHAAAVSEEVARRQAGRQAHRGHPGPFSPVPGTPFSRAKRGVLQMWHGRGDTYNVPDDRPDVRFVCPRP